MTTRLAEQTDPSQSLAIVDPREAAQSAGLRYVSDVQAGIIRQKRGKGFGYKTAAGQRVADKATLERIRALAIPPAYTDVWICQHANGHIQATGRDAKGRKQYRYHPRFREIRDSTKYDHMLEFAAALPAIREKVDVHMAMRGLPREKVLATVVRLLETTMIRVGNADYVKQNKSFGLTTLRDRHVSVDGGLLRFQFKGKSGKQWKLQLHDRRVAKIVKASQDLPGQHLFQYLDGDGIQREVTSGDINLYLKEISGADITAKDFRTWSGTVLAAMALGEFEKVDSAAAAKRNIRDAIEKVAARLGNTPAICRKCYIHPEVIDSYLNDSQTAGALASVEKELHGDLAHMTAEEAVVLAFLQKRLSGKRD
jgi:DNA topoisomerase I